MQNDEMIQNMAAKYKLDDICTHFWTKKTVKNRDILGIFKSIPTFDGFFGPTGSQMLSDSTSAARFGSLSTFYIQQAPICYDFHILL